MSDVISLYSKEFSQEEIAKRIGVSQATVSRDLLQLKQEARSQIDKYLRKDILFKYGRYLSCSNQVTRELWEIVHDYSIDPKDRINALKLLIQSYDNRHKRLIGGPESYLNIKKAESDHEFQDFV